MGISRDYPLQNRSIKQPSGDFSGYKIILFDPLKYIRSKQGPSVFLARLKTLHHSRVFFLKWYLKGLKSIG
jgi:hypothetical protein